MRGRNGEDQPDRRQRRLWRGPGLCREGVAEREGAALRLTFGDCRIVAQYDGDRIVFPATVADACQALCTGRATLAAVTVDRQSMARSEALTLRSSKGTRLCSS
ncbi:hypothetical protein [Sphingomonas sp. 22R3R2A-7]|uniref:hypothetical protein n=1 Tax=Sphingomonas sp. 22R3R2A-7 TaxID=3050230 RepID=UPI002FDF48EA